jgi:hypothetical protein
MPGDLNCYDWLCFSRLYGKYLLSQHYSAEKMQILCPLLDLVKLAVTSFISGDGYFDRLHGLVKEVASTLETYFPAGELSIVIHLLLFHIPAQLARWGPAYGHWCFPFERSVDISLSPIQPHSASLSLIVFSVLHDRFIGKLARYVSRRREPEIQIVMRYCEDVSLNDAQLSSSPDDLITEEHLEPDDVADEDWLSSLDVFHQPEGKPQQIGWPEFTRFKMTTEFKRRLVDCELDLYPMLGAAVLQRLKSFGPHVRASLCRHTAAVQIGRTQYSCHEREATSRKLATSIGSYFAIRARHVPVYVREMFRPTDPLCSHPIDVRLPAPAMKKNWKSTNFLYGQFDSFLQLEIEEWPVPDDIFLLGRVRLYEAVGTDSVSGAPVIDLAHPIQFLHPRAVGDDPKSEDISYVELKYVHHQIILGRCTEEQRARATTAEANNTHGTREECRKQAARSRSCFCVLDTQS